MAIGVFAFLLAMPVAPETVTVTNSEFGTVDGTTLTRNFDVSGASTITDVDILIDFSKCGSPAPGPADTRCLGTGLFSPTIRFVLQLISPSNITVNLVTARTYDIEADRGPCQRHFRRWRPGPSRSESAVRSASNPVDTDGLAVL